MKKMFPPGYQNNCSVPIHILGHMNRTSCAQVHGLQQSHCGNNWENTWSALCALRLDRICSSVLIMSSLIRDVTNYSTGYMNEAIVK